MTFLNLPARVANQNRLRFILLAHWQDTSYNTYCGASKLKRNCGPIVFFITGLKPFKPEVNYGDMCV